jgi:hypothetical protein
MSMFGRVCLYLFHGLATPMIPLQQPNVPMMPPTSPETKYTPAYSMDVHSKGVWLLSGTEVMDGFHYSSLLIIE